MGKGRRKSGDRYPSGKLKRTPKHDVEPMTGAEWQRIVQHGKKLGADERLVTELGRLNRFGELTIVQTTAGHRVAEIYGRYEALHGLRRWARSPSYERSFSSARGESWDLEERMEAAETAFLALQGVIERAGADHRERAVLELLCVEDRHIGPVLLPEMRSLLDAIARAYDISKLDKKQAESKARQADRTKMIGDIPVSRLPKRNVDRDTWIGLMNKMRPDLSDEQLAEAYDIAQALKQREIFRRSKRVPERSNVTTKGDTDA